jgi:all-trans-retinol 13,14-reductase
MKYDTIIIGGGLGGLTAGAKLAKEGKKILLLEQHDRPGGCATTFKRGDFIFEVGLHEMYGPSPGDIQTKIFTDLDVFNHVEFLPVPEFYRFINDRYNVTIPHDPKLASERLAEQFPKETEGIQAYFNQILQPKKKIFETWQDKNVGEFLDSIIKNDDLKLILLGNLGYFHDDPYSLSLSYYSVAQGSYFTGGASFIKGGSQKLSSYLADFIRKHGGEVLLKHLATAIITDNRKVTGVLFKKVNDPESSIIHALTDDVIANTAMPNVADLLNGDESISLKNELKEQKTGASLLTLYLGFKTPVKDSGNSFYSTFIYDNTVKSPKDILQNNHAIFEKRNFTFVDYGQVDSKLAPDGKSVGAICCIDYLDDWENLEEKEYQEKKNQVALTFIQRLDKIIPGVAKGVEYYEIGTPSTVKRYTLNPGGAVYGFAQNPSRKMVNTSMLPENLHFASAWGSTGGGFSGVIYSGYLCAINLLRKKRAT